MHTLTGLGRLDFFAYSKRFCAKLQANLTIRYADMCSASHQGSASGLHWALPLDPAGDSQDPHLSPTDSFLVCSLKINKLLNIA